VSNGLITVDNGNSNPHVGIFQNGLLDAIINFKDFAPYKDEFLNENKFKVLVSNVGETCELLKELILKSIDLTQYKNDGLFIDMPYNYSEGIGDDRLFQSYYIYKKKTLEKENQKRIALIDAGTYITADIVTSDGMLGGFIFPGTQALLDTFKKGANLPCINQSLLKLGTHVNLPENTEQALLESTKLMLVSTFANFFKIYGPFDQVIITGGQGLDIYSLFKNNLSLDSELECEIVPDLIHYSLAFIDQVISQTTSNMHNTVKLGELRSVT
jgi:type III pantothenate kinase